MLLNSKEWVAVVGLLMISWVLMIPEINDGFRPVLETPPAVNLPLVLRQQNWGSGSCVHASTVSLLRWQGLPEFADYWRKAYAGGESFNGLATKLDKNGLKWAGTSSGDTSFLEWASRTRRGAVIFYYPNHSIAFCGFTADGRDAYVLDNNRTDHYIRINKAEFLYKWKSYGGVAVTPIYAPAAPIPYQNLAKARASWPECFASGLDSRNH